MADDARVAALISELREHDRVVHQQASRHIPPTVLPHDLTLRQLQLLLAIRERPGVTGQELADSFGVSTPTISGLVERLVGKELLTRHPDPADRRRVLLSLTQPARDILAEMESVGARVRDEVLGRLTVDELEALVALSARIRQITEELAPERQDGPAD